LTARNESGGWRLGAHSPKEEENTTQTNYISHFALAVGSVTTVCG
jgi:hypothetical protein